MTKAFDKIDASIERIERGVEMIESQLAVAVKALRDIGLPNFDCDSGGMQKLMIIAKEALEEINEQS